MKQRIFRAMLSVTITTLVLGFFFIFGILYQHFDDQMLLQLENEAHYLATAVNQGGVDYLEKLDSDQRITLIDASGDVLFDNQADESEMENHLTREEIQEALNSGQGASERYSKTLSTKTIYYAMRLDNNNVLRIASYQSTVLHLMFYFSIFSIFFLLCDSPVI